MTEIDATAWQPHTEVSTEYVDPGRVAALAALFDDGLPTPQPGDPVPPLWHWVALPHWASSGQLGPDGHPRRGSFLPPVALPRRMFAGGRVRFPGTLRVGETVRREAEVLSVTEKNGRSGSLVIVEVQTRLYTAGETLAIEERQNIVYREAAAPASSSAATPPELVPGQPLSRISECEWELRTDPTLLMRFSAATANAHRIHYDWPYTTGIEGYPGLVVHGPLQALALAETHRLASGAPVISLEHRGNAPLFCGQSARLRSSLRADGNLLELFSATADSAKPGATVDITT